jgi:hypothetical protein
VTVETPSAQAALTGGEALVMVEAKGGTTRVANHTGKKVEVSGYDPVKKKASKKKVTLPVNTGSKVEVGKDPTPPRPLPAPPSWPSTSPIIADSLGETGVVEVEWTAVSQVSNVRLELSRREDGGELVDAQLVPGALSRARFEGLPVGEYWVRLAAIDDDGFEGLVGPARRLVLNKRRVLTPRFEGRADGAPVLPGHIMTLDGMRCALPGETPARRLVMPYSGTLTLECVTEAGDPAPPVVVEVARVELVGLSPAAQIRSERGRAVEVSFATTPAVDRLTIQPPDGWRSTQPVLVGDRWSMKLTPGKTAEAGPLRLFGGAGGSLGSVPLEVVGAVEQEVAAEGAVWSAQPLLSYSALYSDGYRFEEQRVERGLRVGARLNRELGAEFALEGEAYLGHLLGADERGYFMVTGGQLAGMWRPFDGVSPFVLLGVGGELALGDVDGGLWTVSAGLGLLVPLGADIGLRFEVREVAAPAAADGLGLHTQAGLGLTLEL